MMWLSTDQKENTLAWVLFGEPVELPAIAGLLKR